MVVSYDKWSLNTDELQQEMCLWALKYQFLNTGACLSLNTFGLTVRTNLPVYMLLM